MDAWGTGHGDMARTVSIGSAGSHGPKVTNFHVAGAGVGWGEAQPNPNGAMLMATVGFAC